ITADRLIRLGLACADETGALGHIGVRITPHAARFCASDGKLLASLVVPLDDFAGTTGDIILDQIPLTAALKSAAKAPGGRITFKIDTTEARVTNGDVSSVVRCVTGTYPNVDHVWTKPDGQRWIPTVSSLDPHLVSIAQKITGHKQAVLFVSPIEPSNRLGRIWSATGPANDDTLNINSLRAAVRAPAYWADHEMAVLIMPITRNDERQLDLSSHALSLPKLAALAA
ncbi:MAG: hypothetical protein AAB263_15090, partial [Planctomycetota bacterium]